MTTGGKLKTDYALIVCACLIHWIQGCTHTVDIVHLRVELKDFDSPLVASCCIALELPPIQDGKEFQVGHEP